MVTKTKPYTFIGNSESSEKLKAHLSNFAPASAPVLVLGESGVGKEIVCRELHRLSERTGEIVFVNCGAIPDQLLESEIFGHVKGAFTGATCDRKGKFELADNGTLVLDEIGDMPWDLQVKLLRVMEEQVVQPVGSNRSVQTDVRIVAATNKDIESMSRKGAFREDLFHRLNVLPIKVPSLRERSDDIEALALFFISKYSDKPQSPVFSEKSLDAITQYEWPGNVRELSNFVQRVCVLSNEHTIKLCNLPEQFLPPRLSEIYSASDLLEREQELLVEESAEVGDAAAAMGDYFDFEQIIELANNKPMLPDQGINGPEILSDIEKNLVLASLEKTEGNVTKSASLLMMPRTTLIQKMRKFGIK